MRKQANTRKMRWDEITQHIINQDASPTPMRVANKLFHNDKQYVKFPTQRDLSDVSDRWYADYTTEVDNLNPEKKKNC